MNLNTLKASLFLENKSKIFITSCLRLYSATSSAASIMNAITPTIGRTVGK